MLLAVLLLSGAVKSLAQDTLAIRLLGKDWVIRHDVQSGESILSLSSKYNVPVAKLADINKLAYNAVLVQGATVLVPVGAFNLSGNAQPTPGKAYGLTYVTQPAETLRDISLKSLVDIPTIMEWNSLRSLEIGGGRKLFVGWLKAVPNPKSTSKTGASPGVEMKERKQVPIYTGETNTSSPAPGVTVKVISIPNQQLTFADATMVDTMELRSTAEIEFDLQTSNGANVIQEKGSTVFYNSRIVPPNGLYSAFHNTAGRGTIIKVRNINNGRVIYAKVLGPIPTGKQYYGAAMGLSGAARSALGANQLKIYCDYTYAGY